MLYNILTEKLIMPLSDMALKTELWKTFKEWKKIQTQPPIEMKDQQLIDLKKLLLFASINVPYYKNLKIEHCADGQQLLSKFPLLTKNILKEETLLSQDKLGLVKRSSSGSSGIQSTVYMTKKEVSRVSAIQALWWSWAGYRFGNKVLQAGINPQRGVVKRLKDILLRFKYINAFSLSEEDIIALLKDLEKDPRQHLIGYASSLFSMAKTAKKYNIKGVKFTSVMSLGDKMFDHYRTLIEEQFNTKVFDTYGCSEGLMMAGECESGKYHIMTPHIYMELLDDEGNEVSPGEIGNVVITRLDAYAMPLIRYKLGDLAIKEDTDARCSCGRSFPLIEKIIGRETDLINLPSGKFVTVHSFTGIFEYFPEIKQFQVIEQERGLLIRYIKDEAFTIKTLELVKEKLYEKIDKNLVVIFKEESLIEPTASGKPCMVMSKEKAKIYLKSIGVENERA